MRIFSAILVLLLSQAAFAQAKGSLEPPRDGARVWQTEDVSDSDNPANKRTLTGLTLPVQANSTYAIHCRLQDDAAAATTGLQLEVSAPASPTTFRGTLFYPTTATANGIILSSAVNPLSFAATASQGNVRAANQIHIILANGANAGSVTFTVNTEVDTSAVNVYKGSYCDYYLVP